MLLTSDLLIRRRTLLARIGGVLAVAYVLLAEPPRLASPWVAEIGELAGYVLLAVAAFGRIWCLTFIAGRKCETLVIDGPYSVVRNPLYLLSIMGAVGFGLAVENPPLAAILAVFLAVSYPIAVAHEERRLAEAFGAAYTAYRSTTPRWIPNFALYHEPPTHVVDTVKLRRGILDAMWFLWAFLLWEAVEALREAGFIRAWL